MVSLKISETGKRKRGNAVPWYRVFEINEEGHVAGPAKVIDCPDDQQAIEQAKQLKDGKIVEVWTGERRIAEIR
jgi:hypothetical protein